MWKHAKTLEELRQVFDISQLWKAFHTAAALNVPSCQMEMAQTQITKIGQSPDKARTLTGAPA
jgi:hypothetical protein